MCKAIEDMKEMARTEGKIEGIYRIAKLYAPYYDENKILEQVLRVMHKCIMQDRT